MSELKFGHCGTCKFTRTLYLHEKIVSGDWSRLVCQRFPPKKNKTTVAVTEGCYEWQQRSTDEVKE